MSLYVYAPTVTPGLRELLEALQAKRLTKHDGMHFLHKGTPIEFNPSDMLVCWGSHVPPPANMTCLNTSYAYTSLLSVNTKGLGCVGGKGNYAVFPATRMSDHEYAAGLKGTWPKTAPPSGYVSIPELPGYGVQHYKFGSVSKLTVFDDKVLEDEGANSKLAAIAVEVVGQLGLNFGRVTIGTGGVTVILGVNTRPDLNDLGVAWFAKRISTWQKKNAQKDGIIAEMAKLLE